MNLRLYTKNMKMKKAPNESSQQKGNLLLSMLGVNVQLTKFLEEVISSNLSVTPADMNREIFHY